MDIKRLVWKHTRTWILLTSTSDIYIFETLRKIDYV